MARRQRVYKNICLSITVTLRVLGKYKYQTKSAPNSRL